VNLGTWIKDLRPILPMLLALVGAAPSQGGREDAPVKAPAPLAEGRTGMVVGTTGPRAVAVGRDLLKQGGTAAGAVLATALAQVVECGGAYVSYAGILALVYYDAATGQVHSLNAGYNTVLGETDPLSIPAEETPSGRATLVPGFMAGVQAAHDRFGKLPRRDLFAPAAALARDGFPVDAGLAAFIEYRQKVLGRLAETRRIFVKDGGKFLAEGDLFRQPELAQTLKRAAEDGAAFLYTGEWAKRFVAAVQKEGGKITLEDLRAYRPTWEEPLNTAYRGHQVYVPGLASQGGVAMVEALHLLERADLRKLGRPDRAAPSLFRLMQIGQCQGIGFLPPDVTRNYRGRDLSAAARVKKETADWIWKQMQDGTWEYPTRLGGKGGRLRHSDGVVVVDRWGNVAALTHSINTDLWGTTGLFVGGVSIPDSACFQQEEIQWAGPGNRLPNPMCPLVVLRDGKPVLGSSAVGAGLHQKTLQVLAGIFEFGMDAPSSAAAPAPLMPEYEKAKPVAQVEKGAFGRKVLQAVRALGQKVAEVGPEEAEALRGFWVGIHVDPQSGTLQGLGQPGLAAAAGY
jgi:gamma-glutamyltranspeptidase/glutathione hydrolase